MVVRFTLCFAAEASARQSWARVRQRPRPAPEPAAARAARRADALRSLCIAGKPRGINAARKLRTVRRTQRWANKHFKKANLGTQFKCNPFGGSSHCKGIVLEKM